jgi:hypothetical protein
MPAYAGMTYLKITGTLYSKFVTFPNRNCQYYMLNKITILLCLLSPLFMLSMIEEKKEPELGMLTIWIPPEGCGVQFKYNTSEKTPLVFIFMKSDENILVYRGKVESFKLNDNRFIEILDSLSQQKFDVGGSELRNPIFVFHCDLNRNYQDFITTYSATKPPPFTFNHGKKLRVVDIRSYSHQYTDFSYEDIIEPGPIYLPDNDNNPPNH